VSAYGRAWGYNLATKGSEGSALDMASHK
jgi:hypothetical protein